ncbi:TRAP transporter small permease subunit [Psychromarinibacter sp. C21-152]|uniref:TRAP transporter small permease protein n=1 Tax=Psychromarinibacter sediminicola TaxID=3033385 RepID=A0AAE3T942_9RHOB|nr:TRAP transporter small permease subunit [Psychromarinibacter sediminicola]MDF0601448.1 TRAP transporter small permease subunit [Psychromarinibacter sediminicola]
MRQVLHVLRRIAEGLAAVMMAAMFLTFVLQITVRYTARLDWLPELIPILEPSQYGWTLEFCLLLWVWIIFFGNAFVVRDRDHVTFDILYNGVGPNLRRAFAIIGGLAVVAALLLSVAPTWDRFDILRLKRTATLSQLVGDWVRVRDVYAVYILFLVVVAARYAWLVIGAIRRPPPKEEHLPRAEE